MHFAVKDVERRLKFCNFTGYIFPGLRLQKRRTTPRILSRDEDFEKITPHTCLVNCFATIFKRFRKWQFAFSLGVKIGSQTQLLAVLQQSTIVNGIATVDNCKRYCNGWQLFGLKKVSDLTCVQAAHGSVIVLIHVKHLRTLWSNIVIANK